MDRPARAKFICMVCPRRPLTDYGANNDRHGGRLSNRSLPVPAHFEQAAKMVSEEDVAKKIVCGPDPERYLAKINEYVEAGFDHVWLHQVGPDQEGFFRFFEKEVFPKLDRE